MAHLGGVFQSGGMFFAKVDTKESGEHYKMEGPLRGDHHEAHQDLDYIRSAAEGEVTRAEGLQSMKLAAKELRDEAKAETQAKKLAAKKATKMVKDEAKAETQAKKLAAKQVNDGSKAEAKADTRGFTKAVGADSHHARIHYVENSVEKEICGPRRRSERRANIDLSKPRKAAQGKNPS
jgi:hypothetical protein